MQRFKPHVPAALHTARWKRIHWLVSGALACALLAGLLAPAYANMFSAETGKTAAAPAAFDAPTHSSPITMSANRQHIWVVNPDDDSVSVIGDLDGTPRVLNKFTVGDEPQSVAVDTDPLNSDAYNVYVANAASNSVTILNVTSSTADSVNAFVQRTLVTGGEPWNIVASPDGQRVFVANSSQDTITVIRTDTQAVVGNVDLRNSICNDPDRARHFQPRGLAVTLDNDRLFVTRFLSYTQDGGVQGDDVGKEGVVCQLDIPADLNSLPGVANVIRLGPQDTGFAIDSNGDGVNDPTSAFPNQLQSIVLRGNQAFVPNIAASPSRPLRFNVDTHAFVNVIDNAAVGAPVDASDSKFLNLHLGARDPEPDKERLFFANPWAMAFTTQSGDGEAYVVSAGSDLLVKVNVDATGTLSFTVDANTTRYIDLNDPENLATSDDNAGKNPLGIVIRDDIAYVMNFISRNVSLVDLTTDSVVEVLRLTDLPPAGSQAEQLLIGKEMFFSSRGHFDRPSGTTVSTDNRLSQEGWQNCGSCHFAGLTDGVIWQFVPGPRKSIPMNSTWSPHNPDDQRILNYSAFFDEVEDFEINVRNISGPGPLAEPIAGSVQDPDHGLLISDTGNINFAPAVINAFTLPNAGRPQHTVTLPDSDTSWPALTAMKEWIRFSIRTPNGALTSDELVLGGGDTVGGLSPLDVAQGRLLFFTAGCQTCHGGTKWTISSKDFTSPPAAEEIFTEAGAEGVFPGQFLDRFLADIDSFDLGVAGEGNPIGDDVGAVEVTTAGLTALGADHNGDGAGAGFNIPSLLAISQLPPYYHNGACETLNCVLSNETHRQAGLRPGQSDPLAEAEAQENLIAFLRTLDADTAFPLDLRVTAHDIFSDPPRVFRGREIIIGANVSLFGTRADLEALLDQFGLTELAVRFDIEVDGDTTQLDVPFSPDAFNQDFGQAVITTTFDVPSVTADSDLQVLTIVDADDELAEDNEANNSDSRTIRLHNAPPDTRTPLVQSMAISDGDPFEDNDPVTVSSDVRIKLVAQDPGDAASGVEAYCIVGYFYDAVSRRWVPQDCEFAALPEPEAGTDDTFIVSSEVQDTFGVAYAFAWVRDAAGNISRIANFDVISFIPDEPGRLNRNDARIFRIPLAEGESLDFTFTPDFGDIDVAVFDDFTNPQANLLELSSNRGITPEQVSLEGPGLFQIEVGARENSRFDIDFAPGAGAAAGAVSAASTPLVAPSQDFETPLVAGPPALQTAIDDDLTVGQEDFPVFLPLIRSEGN